MTEFFKVDLATAPKKRTFGQPKYDFDGCAIGHAFKIEQVDGKPRLTSVKTYCHDHGKRLGRSFRYQQRDGYVLVWREEDPK